jgi:FkbM family methyltransferase
MKLTARYAAQLKPVYEGLIRLYPEDVTLFKAYVDILRATSEAQCGFFQIEAPGVPYPMWCRARTSDVENFAQIFLREEYGFDFPEDPQRILDLGAYAGFAAVYLANRFKGAEIFCVEADTANYESLRLNTAPYPNIRTVHAAAWNQRTALHLEMQHGGAWGNVFSKPNSASEGSVSGYPVPDLLRMAGWDVADFVKCDIEGSEVEVFGSADLSWMLNTAVISVETHDRFRKESSNVVDAAFASGYERDRSGEFVIFRKCGLPCTHGSINLIETVGSPHSERILATSSEWGFRLIGNDCFQLHPGAVGGPPAQIRLPIDLGRAWVFKSRITVAHPEAHGPVRFSIQLADENGPVTSDERICWPEQEIDWSYRLPQRSGPHLLTLTTEMTPEASGNGYAWARWTRPRLERPSAV